MKHKKNLHLRALIIQAIRNYFINFDYLEVETPIRLPVFIPETYIEPVESELWYLQTSPELCMKRLLCAGYDKIFQICKCFRKNERGEKHLPEEKGALAKRKSSDKSLVERFELYISGIELCNAFTELTDPVEQRIRFENEIILKKKDNISQSQIPEKFLKSLETMPDAAGIAFGIDRLVMLFANAETIDMVTTFTPEEL